MIANSRSKADMGWMISFADLLALLLTFFVLSFSMRTVPFEEWRALVEALRSELSLQDISVEPVRPVDDTEPSPLLAQALEVLSLDYLKALIRDADLASDPAAADIRAVRDYEKLLVSIPLPLMFEPSSNVLRPSAIAFLDRLATRLDLLPNGLLVRISDDSRMAGGKYAGIWELSLARADSVADRLIAAGYQDIVGRAAMLDVQLSMAERALPPGRRADRRKKVDIVLLDYRRGTDDVASY